MSLHDGWADLSDDELTARLTARGWLPVYVEDLVRDRDLPEVAEEINDALEGWGDG